MFWIELVVRICATGFLVIVVTWSASRLGPVAGGVIVGLPIVIAPTFFFMITERSPVFVASAAAGALYALCAMQFFVAAYIVASRYFSGVQALLASTAIWIIAAFLLRMLPQSPAAGLLLFLVVTLLSRRAVAHFVPRVVSTSSELGWGLLMSRSFACGLAVGLVTLMGGRLGPELAGTLIAFPIGLSTVILSISQDHGKDAASQTAYASLIGTGSIAAFCVTVAVTAAAMSPWTSFGAALLAALATTVILGILTRRRVI